MPILSLALFVRKLALGIVKSALPPGVRIAAKIVAKPGPMVRTLIRGPMRRSIVLRTLQRMATAKTPLPSGANMLGLLRQYGLGIRTQDFYRLFRSFKKQGTFGAKLAIDPVTTRILRADVPAWPGFLSGRYLYQFDMRVFDYKTDKWRTKTFRMSSTKLYRTKELGAEAVRSWWAESGFRKEVELATVHITEIWKSPKV